MVYIAKKYCGGKAPNGKGIYMYYPIERIAHQRFTIEEAKIYGKGIRHYPPYIDYWYFFRQLIGGF